MFNCFKTNTMFLGKSDCIENNNLSKLNFLIFANFIAKHYQLLLWLLHRQQCCIVITDVNNLRYEDMK